MKKLLCAALALFLTVLAAPSSAAADYKRVTDNAGLFSKAEISALEEACQEFTDVTGFDCVILTMDQSVSNHPEYCQNFFDMNYGRRGIEESYYYSGVLLYVNMTDRDVFVAAYGDGMSLLSLNDCTAIREAITPALGDKRYYGAAADFIARSVEKGEDWVAGGSPIVTYDPSQVDDDPNTWQDYDPYRSRVVDSAGLLEESFVESLDEECQVYHIISDYDCVILTLHEDVGDEFEYMDTYFGSYYGRRDATSEYYYSGVLLYYNTLTELLHIRVYGDQVESLTLNDSDAIYAAVAAHIENGRTEDAFSEFVFLVREDYLDYTGHTPSDPSTSSAPISHEPYSYGFTDLMDDMFYFYPGQTFAIVFIITGIFMLVLVILNRSKIGKGAPSGSVYVDRQSIVMHRTEDSFLRTHTTRTARPKDTGSSGGSSIGSGGHSSSSGGSGGSGGGHGSSGKF